MRNAYSFENVKPQQVLTTADTVEMLLDDLKGHRYRGGFSGPLREIRAVWWDLLRDAQVNGVDKLKHRYSGNLAAYVRYVCELRG